MPGWSLPFWTQQCYTGTRQSVQKRIKPPPPGTWNEDENVGVLKARAEFTTILCKDDTGIRQCSVSIGCFSPNLFPSYTVYTASWTSSTVFTNQVRRQGIISSPSNLLRNLSSPPSVSATWALEKYIWSMHYCKERFSVDTLAYWLTDLPTIKGCWVTCSICTMCLNNTFAFYNTWHKIQISSIIKIKKCLNFPSAYCKLASQNPQYYFCLNTDIYRKIIKSIIKK